MRGSRLSKFLGLALLGLAWSGSDAAAKIVHQACFPLGAIVKNGQTFYGARCSNPTKGWCACSAWYCFGVITNAACMPLTTVKQP
jgi:hypothetical protein